jgi:hypothetical protein
VRDNGDIANSLEGAKTSLDFRSLDADATNLQLVV